MAEQSALPVLFGNRAFACGQPAHGQWFKRRRFIAACFGREIDSPTVGLDERSKSRQRSIGRVRLIVSEMKRGDQLEGRA